MKKGIIAVDIDDVIADSTESVRLQVNRHTGATLTRQDYQVAGEYSQYYDRVWQTHGLADKVSFDNLSTDMTADQSHVPIIAGAREALQYLAKEHKLIAVTARDKAWAKATEEWLGQNLPGIIDEIHFTGHRKSEGYRSKGELCRMHGVMYLIDDNPDHCKSAANEGVETILFGTYGWHEGVNPEQIRCKDWSSVMEFFDARARD